jgi:hypothetical protein
MQNGKFLNLTLLCRLVVCSLLGTIYSAMEVVFTQFIDRRTINPIHLPFGQSVSAFSLFRKSRSLSDSSLSFTF